MKFNSLVKAAVLALGASAVVSGSALAAGVSGPAFYVDGKLYRTVGTPTDLTGTGAPESSFQVIYAFGDYQRNVATAAPGDPGYRGGRWIVRGLDITDYAGALADDAVDLNGNDVIDSDEEVMAGMGIYWTAGAELKRFECPVIAVPANQQP